MCVCVHEHYIVLYLNNETASVCSVQCLHNVGPPYDKSNIVLTTLCIYNNPAIVCTMYGDSVTVMLCAVFVPIISHAAMSQEGGTCSLQWNIAFHRGRATPTGKDVMSSQVRPRKNIILFIISNTKNICCDLK